MKKKAMILTREMLPKMAEKPKKRTNFAFFSIGFFLIVSLGITMVTHGRFLQSFIVNDTASVAKFDVTIIPPEGFYGEQDKRVFEYYFLSAMDFQGLFFQIINNGETDVLCKPSVHGDISYRIYFEENECGEFAVAAKEASGFWLVIAPDNLENSIQDAVFCIDITQIERKEMSG